MSNRKLYKNTSCQTDAHRAERLYAAVEQFQYSAELAKRVYHLGTPHFADSIPTALLTVTEKGKPIFSFNRAFFDSLDQIALVFVILHETLHFVFCHHSRCYDRQPALWNIATDLVVNIFLLQKVGFAEVSSHNFHKFLESAITFANLPIAPTSDRLFNLTAEEVYDLLVENLQGTLRKASNLKACDEHIWLGSNADGDSGQGKSPDENLEDIKEKPSDAEINDERISSDASADEDPGQDEALDEDSQDEQGEPSSLEDSGEHDSPGFSADSGSEQSDPLDEFAELAQRVFRDWLPVWGNTPSGELRAIGETDKSFDIDWDYILSRRIASCIQITSEERWAPPNRKIAWLYPDVLLPAEHQVEQYQSSVLMAIDSSGSVTTPVLNRLIDVARSIPTDRVELTTISFDTRIYSVDIWENTPAICGGGGTSFQSIEEFARQSSRYPDLIVVLTDGRAPQPTVLRPGRWFWLITERGITKYIKDIGRYCRINCSKPVFKENRTRHADATSLITNHQGT